jgi:puromycin-sensitive aminopeptidase
VTVDWWSDLWLQEGAARYFENFAVQDARPDWNQSIAYIAFCLQLTMSADQSGDQHPIYNPDIEHYGDIENMFSTITYDKVNNFSQKITFSKINS